MNSNNKLISRIPIINQYRIHQLEFLQYRTVQQYRVFIMAHFNQTPDLQNTTVGKIINGSIYNTTYITQNLTNPSFLQQHKFTIFIILFISLILIRLIRRKKQTQRNTIYIVGQRNAGKTQLIYALSKGANLQTVPSIKNNTTSYRLNNKKDVELVDVAGANHTKEQFVSNIEKAVAIIQVIDGTDAQSLLGAAELLYKILISKSYQKVHPRHCLFLNKSDSAGFLGQKMFQKKVEDEMQRIKLSRRTMIQEKEGEDDFIKQQKMRWNFQQYDIKVVGGSVKENKLSGLQQFLTQVA